MSQAVAWILLNIQTNRVPASVLPPLSLAGAPRGHEVVQVLL